MKYFVNLICKFRNRSKNSVKNKAGSRNMALLYLLYIMVPLVITDSIFAYVINSGDRAELEKSYANVADGLEYHFKDALDYASNMATSIIMNEDINGLLEKDYASTYDYYTLYQSVIEEPYFSMFRTVNSNKVAISLYTDNETLLTAEVYID